MCRFYRHILISLIIISSTFGVTAREHGYFYPDPDDSLYFKASQMAVDGDFEKARLAALSILERNPEYYDAAVLVGRLHAWKARYDSSRLYLNQVISNMPDHYDALSAIIDVEIWSESYTQAVSKADTALLLYPDDTGFLIQKAKALIYQGMIADARKILNDILETDPENPEAVELLKSIDIPGFYYYRENSYLLGGYHGEFFRDPFNRSFHMGTAGYSHFTGKFPVTFKLNFANIWLDGTGLGRLPSFQYEVEAYPKLTSTSYLLLNYAYSPDIVFPGHRGAFEYFRGLSRGYELSAGIRFIRWDSEYFFYTGSIGKYYGDLWLSLRSYILPYDEGIDASWYFNARKYFNTSDDFAGIILGFGFSPDETVSDPDERLSMRNYSTGLEMSKGLGASYLVRGSIRYEYEEYRTGSLRNRWTINFGLRYYL